MARKLFHIPAWHNRIDWGIHEPANENEDPRISLARAMPERYWKMAEMYWDIVDAAFDRLDIADWAKVRIFSDSTTEISAITETVTRELARKGSRHAQVETKLLDRGAKLEITEDEILFFDTGNDVKEWLDVPLEKRDRVISHNINMRLQDGEIGFLILGMSHRIWLEHLDSDIEVESLLKEEDAEKFEEQTLNL